MRKKKQEKYSVNIYSNYFEVTQNHTKYEFEYLIYCLNVTNVFFTKIPAGSFVSRSIFPPIQV